MSIPKPARPPAVPLLCFSALYFSLSWLALWLAQQPGKLGMVWFAGALGSAWLLRHPRAQAPATVLCAAGAGLLARLLLGQTPGWAAAAALADVLELALAAELLRRRPGYVHFDDHPQSFLHLLIFGCCLPPLLGATLTAPLQVEQGLDSFANAWSLRYLGSVVGAATMLPLALIALRSGPALLLRIGYRRAAMLALLAVTSCVLALCYLPFPLLAILAPLTIVALSLSFECTALLVLLTAAVAGAMFASGQFVLPPIYGRWQKAAIYVPLLATLISPLMLAVSINQSRRKDAQRILVEQQLERNHQKLQTIIDNMPALVGYWDHRLMNGFGNRAYLDWFGKTPDQMRGAHISDVIGEERYRLNLPYIEQALRGESPLFERTIVDTTGVARHSLASYVPDVADGKVLGFYAFVTDISPLKQAQRQQLEARTQLQAVIDSASEFSIIATDAQGCITLFNQGAERMLGYRAEELVHLQSPLPLHLPEELAARAVLLTERLGRPVAGLEAVLALARLGQADQQIWHYRRKDGSTLPVRLVVTAMHDADGAVIGFLGIANDITEQLQLQASLVMAKEQAEAASLAKSAFVANMSHEIRTPLNAVLGMADLLDGPGLTPEQRKYVAMIGDSGRSLLGILNDILDFEKVEAGRMELSPQPFRLDDMLATLAGIMTVNAGGKRLDLALGVAAGVPELLVGDRQRLQQVLVNLLGNAIKFTAAGEVGLLVELAPQPAAGGAPLLRFTVRDTGIGIAADQQQQLFSPFAQGDSSISRRYGGTGLGLAISRRLVELMGGRIELHSVPGEGSQFCVTMPLRRAEEQQDGGADWSTLRLLLVGPARASRASLSQTLGARQASVDCADDAAAGAILLRSGQHYDAVLIDCHCAPLAGISALPALRALAPASLPMLLLAEGSARASLVDAPEATLADAVLVKPVTAGMLQDSLRRLQLAPAEALPAPARLDGVRVLLVEDNVLNQIVARGMLERAGASVTLAEHGALALARLEQGPADFDLVLMDVQMPVMDGHRTARAIRGQLGLTLPILAMTAGVTQSEQRQCLASGMNDVIAKPVEAEHMLAAVARQLERAAAAPAVVAPAVAAPAGEDSSASLEQLLRLGENNPPYRAKMLELIGRTVQGAAGELEQARLAWREQRPQDSIRLLHSLRGAVGMLGARRFAALSLELEQWIVDGRQQQVDAGFGQAEAALQPVLESARRWLAAQPA